MPRYISDNRTQALYVTGSLESLLPGNSVARLVWAALEQLDFGAFAAAYKNDEADTDTMRCPAGQTLRRRKLNNDKTSVVYQAPQAELKWHQLTHNLCLLTGIWQPMSLTAATA